MNKVQMWLRVEKFSRETERLLWGIRKKREHIKVIDYNAYGDEAGLSTAALKNRSK